METLHIKAMAKINLGLDVIGRLENGYHKVRMIMQTVNLCDELILTKTKESGVRLITDNREIPADETNLACCAIGALLQKHPVQGGVKIELAKRIPVAAGMAGGSTDAAAALAGFYALFKMKFPKEELKEIAGGIGADVPYCLMGGTVLAEGIGEILTPVPKMPECWLVIAKPDLYVSTGSVYRKLRLETLADSPCCPDISGMIQAAAKGSLQGMADCMGNVLETVTAKEHPVIGQLKAMMKETGAINALMSGSGPAVFGVYADARTAQASFGRIKESGLAKQLFVTTPIGETCIVGQHIDS